MHSCNRQKDQDVALAGGDRDTRAAGDDGAATKQIPSQSGPKYLSRIFHLSSVYLRGIPK